MRKKTIWMLIITCSLCFSFSGRVFADKFAWQGTSAISPWSSGGGSDCSDNENRWRIDCAGVSWAYYKYTGSGETNPSLPYSFGAGIEDIKENCARKVNGEWGGFWHFGINSIGAYLYEYDGGHYVGTGGADAYLGHWATLSYKSSGYTYKKPDDSNFSTYKKQKIGGYELQYYADDKTKVEEAYKVAYGKNKLPDDLYGFCYNETTVQAPSNPTIDLSKRKIYSQSFVSLRDPSNTSDLSDYQDTGIWEENSESGGIVTAERELTIPSDGSSVTVTMIFSHNLFSDMLDNNYDFYRYHRANLYRFFSKDSDINFDASIALNSSTVKNAGATVENYYSNGENSRECYVGDSESLNCRYSTQSLENFINYNYKFDGKTKDNDISFPSVSGSTYNGKRLYTNANKYYINVSGNDKYFYRDVYKATFTKTGTFIFCEKINFVGNYGNADNTRKDMTTSCAKFIVKKADVPPSTDEYELIGIPVDTNYNRIANDLTSGKVKSGGTASITAEQYIYDGNGYYVFREWMKIDKETFLGKDLTYRQKLTGNVTVYAVYDYYKNEAKITGGLSVKCVDDDDSIYNKVDSKNGTDALTYCKEFDKVVFDYSLSSDKTGNDVKTKYCFTHNKNCELETEFVFKKKNNVFSSPSEGNFEKIGSYSGLLKYDTNKSLRAYGVIPYNFKINSSETLITALGSRGYVYSNRDTVVSAKVMIAEKYNDYVKKTYATGVDKSEVRVITYVSSEKDTSDSEIISGYNGSMGDYVTIWQRGSDYGLSGISATDVKSQLIHVGDVKAGDYFCVKLAVYPFESRGNEDTPWWSDNASYKNSYSWFISKPVCAVVSKAPSIQVWGGSIYTNGNIDVSYSSKKEGGNLHINGSWAEQAIIRGGGTLKGLGSGASLGYSSDREGGGGKSFQNNNENKLMKEISPLTISNDLNSTVGNTYVSDNKKVDAPLPIPVKPNTSGGSRKTIIDRFVKDGECIASSGCVKSNSLDVSGMTGTKFIYVDGDIEINSEIKILDGIYSLIGAIPKLIIYANNIKISCGVSRIDAVLITKEKGYVDTCYENYPDEDSRRSNQLKINGSIIADTLKAGRTYGAGVGKYAVIPAEIIDYDASLYLWSAAGTGVKTGDGTPGEGGERLDVVNVRELAPRL